MHSFCILALTEHHIKRPVQCTVVDFTHFPSDGFNAATIYCRGSPPYADFGIWKDKLHKIRVRGTVEGPLLRQKSQPLHTPKPKNPFALGPTVPPLSWDKSSSKNPGTKPLSDCHRKCQKKSQKWQKKSFSKIVTLKIFFLFCPLAVPWYCRTGRDRLSKSIPGLSCGKMSKSYPGPFHGKILRLSHCPFVSGQWRDFCPFVQLDKKILSRWKP